MITPDCVRRPVARKMPSGGGCRWLVPSPARSSRSRRIEIGRAVGGMNDTSGAMSLVWTRERFVRGTTWSRSAAGGRVRLREPQAMCEISAGPSRSYSPLGIGIVGASGGSTMLIPWLLGVDAEATVSCPVEPRDVAGHLAKPIRGAGSPLGGIRRRPTRAALLLEPGVDVEDVARRAEAVVGGHDTVGSGQASRRGLPRTRRASGVAAAQVHTRLPRGGLGGRLPGR